MPLEAVLAGPGDATHEAQDARVLRELFDAALVAADPRAGVASHLPPMPRGRLIVVGAGKASALMASAVEERLDDVGGAVEGLVVVPYGYAAPCRSIEIVEADHPVPDGVGEAATGRLLDLAASAGADDLVLALISGGGSSLLVRPVAGVTLSDKQALARALLRSGAPIAEVNLVRTWLSVIKGGGLAAAAAPARVFTMLVSDVPGDHPATIASGPTFPPIGSPEDALAVLQRRRIEVPDRIRRAILAGRGGPRPVVTGDHALVTRPQAALEAAAQRARQLGLTPLILGDALEGESRQVAGVMAGIARQVRRYGQPLPPPCVLLSGGETSVTVSGNGQGGRNVEFLLALTLALAAEPGISALACDTDGVDGTEPVAGAIVGPDTLARAEAMGLDPRAHLDDNDAHPFFARLGTQVCTGPTLTNVNDFRAVLIR